MDSRTAPCKRSPLRRVSECLHFFDDIGEHVPFLLSKYKSNVEECGPCPCRESRECSLKLGHPALGCDVGITADSPLNSWSQGKPLGGIAKKWLGKRLDYILFRSPKPHGGPHLDVQETNVVFTEKVPGKDYSYSDHSDWRQYSLSKEPSNPVPLCPPCTTHRPSTVSQPICLLTMQPRRTRDERSGVQQRCRARRC